MQVRVLVVVFDNGVKVRRFEHVKVSPKAKKLYEAIATGDEIMGFIADDVMSAAIKAVQERSTSKAALETQANLPGKDKHGRPTGNTMLEDTLGLGIVEKMIEKDGAGAAKTQQQFPGALPQLPPLRR